MANRFILGIDKLSGGGGVAGAQGFAFLAVRVKTIECVRSPLRTRRYRFFISFSQRNEVRNWCVSGLRADTDGTVAGI